MSFCKFFSFINPEMAANMKKNNHNVSPLKNSQVCIPNGFKSQDQLRPWNKMISRKKIDSPPSTGEGTLPMAGGEVLQTNGHSHPSARPAHINSSGSARQSLQECFSRNFHIRSNPPSERNHSLNTGERLSKICRTNGDRRSANHSFLSDDDDVDCHELSKEAPNSPPAPCNGDLLNQSDGSDVLSFSKYVGINSTSTLPSTIRHPNKAVCTIDAKSSQILTANEMACALFGYDRADMIRKRLIDLIQLKKKDEKTIMESYLQPNGEIIGITGKVVDAIDKNGLVLPVSLWMKRLDYNKKSRCLVAMEPAHRLVCSMFFDIKGTILSCEEKLAHLYGFTDPEDVAGLNINELIPGFRLPNSSFRISKQRELTSLQLGEKTINLNPTSDGSRSRRATVVASTDNLIYVHLNVDVNVWGPFRYHTQPAYNCLKHNVYELVFFYNVKKQRATGRSLDGSVFPLSVHVQSVAMSSSCEDEDGGTHKSCCRKLSKSDEMYEAIVCVFSSITGLITFFPDGTIHSVNHHFALMLFGYSSVELVGKNVSLLIPEFYSIISTNVPDKATPISPVNSSMTRSSIGEMFSPNKMKKKGTKLHCPDLTAAEKRRFSDITFDQRLAAKERQSRLSKGLKPKDSSTPYRIPGRLKLNEISDNSFEDLRMPFETVPYDPQCSDIESSSGDEFQPSPVSLTKDSDPHVDNGFDCETELCKDSNNSCGSATKPKSERTLANQDLPLSTAAAAAAVNLSSEKPNSTEKVSSAEISRSSKTIACLSAEDSESKETVEKNLVKKTPVTDDRTSSSARLLPPKNCNNDDRPPSTKAMVKLEPELALIDAKMEALCVDCESSLTGYSSADTEDEDNETSKANVAVCSPTRLPKSKRAANVLPPKGLCLGEENVVPSTDSSLPNVIHSQNESLTEDCDEASVSWKYTKVSSPRKRFSEKTKVERMIASPETLESDEEDSFEFFEREIEKKYQNKELLPGGQSLDLDSDEDGINLQSKKHSPSVANSLNNGKHKSKPSAFAKKKINVTPEAEQTPEIESNLQQLSGVAEKKAAENYHKAALRNSLLQRHNRSLNSNNGVTELEDLCVQENLSPLDENIDGHFAGVCQHKDASLISINFSVNPMHLETGELMFCLWVSQDLNQSSLNNFTLDVPSSSNDESMGISDAQQIYTSSSPRGGKTAEVIEESYPPCKAFDANYQNLRTVGHGAFGFVVESLEQSTKLEVIVKYILRSKVLSENWRDDPVLGRIPLEVSLLSHISHPNIVQVLNVFFNKEYVLMVMEKHGTGMDLFEFIEHKPVMDEGLHSYIFRQLVSAIAYLHRSGIVHRDIKDENIIVNEHFHIKLIDFGSAAYMEPGEMFATFCGTVEYCSPEVLMGNWYEGPELEVWSMGVTLYTLVYGENPFFTVDDILACNFKPPFPVSDYLTNLLCLMLLLEPSDRITVEELETDGWVFQPVDMTQYSWREVMALSDGPTIPEYEVVYDEPSSYEDSLRLNCIHTMSSIPSPSSRFKSRLHFRSY